MLRNFWVLGEINLEDALIFDCAIVALTISFFLIDRLCETCLLVESIISRDLLTNAKSVVSQSRVTEIIDGLTHFKVNLGYPVLLMGEKACPWNTLIVG